MKIASKPPVVTVKTSNANIGNTDQVIVGFLLKQAGRRHRDGIGDGLRSRSALAAEGKLQGG
jgi:hypothetical protein